MLGLAGCHNLWQAGMRLRHGERAGKWRGFGAHVRGRDNSSLYSPLFRCKALKIVAFFAKFKMLDFVVNVQKIS